MSLASLISNHHCTCCGANEERVFVDTWTAEELCLECIGQVWNETTNSPASEGDNLKKLLKPLRNTDDDEEEVE
jgi:hypothetical protein